MSFAENGWSFLGFFFLEILKVGIPPQNKFINKEMLAQDGGVSKEHSEAES